MNEGKMLSRFVVYGMSESDTQCVHPRLIAYSNRRGVFILFISVRAFGDASFFDEQVSLTLFL